jgi:cytochrome c heme-lyase
VTIGREEEDFHVFSFFSRLSFVLISLSMGNTASNPAAQQQGNGATSSPPPGCPMHQEEGKNSERINPLNQMPESLSQSPHSSQRSALPNERTLSSIPRSLDPSVGGGAKGEAAAGSCPHAGEDDKWVYPSPQQFHNALLRKGKGAPEEHVETMVQIHNFLNERAWDEVRKWEDRRTG